MSGGAQNVTDLARRANVEWIVVAPALCLLPHGEEDAVARNGEANRVVDLASKAAKLLDMP